MRKLMIGSIALGLAAASQAVVIDDFSSATTIADNYTSTIMLDTTAGSHNTAAWDVTGGTLQLVTTAYDGIEQAALVRNGLTLAVGEEVQLDVTGLPSGSTARSIGLFVGGQAPADGVRENYLTVYGESSGVLYSRGFDGATEYGTYNYGVQTYDKMFIARTDANTYECGWYNGATRNVAVTRTPGTALDAQYVGLYSDVRVAGTLGTVDNLTVIPEPATFGLVGLFGAGVLFVRRRFMM